MAVAGCINAYDCAGCYLTTLQQLQSDNIGVAINYTAPGEYGRRQLDYIKYTDKCGCTCCLTGENELRIVATQGVIKNFTLTNDDTNEKVNVKWNDLFGSNRAYTMVRYKTGSYPTSISDGTLAVKETIQNQYSVSGYNVSGLTDGTTYYFTAFAVSQDGTIIVVQQANITTDFDWTPTANTIGYRPLLENFNDKLGNYNLTNKGSTTISSVGGISAALFSNALNSGLYNDNIPIPTGNATKTVNFRAYPTSYNSAEEDAIFIGNDGRNNEGYILYNINPLSYSSRGNSTNSSTNIQLNTRSNIILSNSGNTMYMYVNGVQVHSGSITISTQGNRIAIGTGRGNNDKTTYKYIGYINRVILENIFRNGTASSQYYNKMKSKYGIN